MYLIVPIFEFIKLLIIPFAATKSIGYEWAKIDGEFIGTLTEQQLTDVNQPYKLTVGSAKSLMSAIGILKEIQPPPTGGKGGGQIENIFVNLLPPLESKSGSSSEPSISKHEPASLITRSFSCLSDPPSHPVGITLWSKARSKQKLLYSTEADIQYFVRLCLEDIIESCNISAHWTSELGITGHRPDIWVILDINGLPIGVIEIKKPGSRVMENNKIHGKIFNYMTKLKEMYGQKNVYGIVSTYSQWRIYWLPGNESVNHTKLETENIKIVSKIQYPTTIPSGKKTIFLSTGGESATPLKRVVYGTDILNSDNNQLPLYLYSVLKKMYYSPRLEEIALVSKDRMYIQINYQTWYWIKLGSKFKLSYDIFTLSKVSHAILLVDLKGGAHGRVWFCSDKEGNVFILKYSFITDKTDAKAALQIESSRWETIWNLDTTVALFNGEWCILIPFLATATDEDWNDDEFIKIVKQSIKTFASKNLVHKDLHKRHVGKYIDGKQLKVVFFDLSHVDMCDSVQAEIEMVAQLFGIKP